MERRIKRSAFIYNSGRVLQFKGCPRCGGDMHGGRDIYGEFDTCLQCGHTIDVVSPERMAAMLGDMKIHVDEVA